MQEIRRRELFTKIFPGCSLWLMGLNCSLANVISSKLVNNQDLHKFQSKFEEKLTISQIWDFRFKRDFIWIFILKTSII